jgi:Fe-S-cluster-containing dehydrogenase component
MLISRRSLVRRVAAGAAGAAASVAAGAAAGSAKPPLPDAVGLLYDATRCIGCQACVVRCREVNGLSPRAHGALWDAPADLDGSTKSVIKLARDGDRTSFFKAQCMHCVDPACVSVCMMGALHKVEHGIVAYDKDLCVGCRYCQLACPFDVPKFEWTSRTPEIVKCDLCRRRQAEGKLPGCVEACPRQAVVSGRRDALLAEAHARIAAHPDRYQPKVYGEHDGGGTQSLYLSAIPFDRLGLPDLGDEATAVLPETIQHGIYQGFVAPAALYAALGLVVLRNRRHPAPDADGEVES